MGRRSNQVRVVDPEQDRRLHLIGETLIRDGYPAVTADILAEGFVGRLRRRVYAALDDVIGSGDDLEALAGWKGPPRSLAAAMLRAGYVREINGVLVMVDAVNEAPEYVKKRWSRQKPLAYKQAVARCGKPNIANEQAGYTDDDGDDWDFEAEMKKESDMQEQIGLFGAEPDKPGEKHVATPGFTELKEFWHARYREVEGITYPWRSRDFAELKRIIDALHDVHRAKRAIDKFLACRERFYEGHELRKLTNDLARFAGADAAGIDPQLRSQAGAERGRL
jgi:hypothetical protein